jgi:hypothetical protein
MYKIDLLSLVIGYIIGVLLCYSNMSILFADDQ